jgi:hypothetical protein
MLSRMARVGFAALIGPALYAGSWIGDFTLQARAQGFERPAGTGSGGLEIPQPYGNQPEFLPIPGRMPDVPTTRPAPPAQPEDLFTRCKKLTAAERKANPPLYCEGVR